MAGPRCAGAARPQPGGAALAVTRAGFASTRRLDAAEGVLRALSLTHDFAPIVLLAGHGSSTVNNPHAAGLDCGACGGHTGESNARVAASVLNNPTVREGLVARRIVIPAGTRFLAGLHDTTTDEVTLHDADLNDPAIAQLRGWLHLFPLGAEPPRAMWRYLAPGRWVALSPGAVSSMAASQGQLETAWWRGERITPGAAPRAAC